MKSDFLEHLKMEYNKPFSGWNFKEFKIESDPLKWDYKSVVEDYLQTDITLLDMGTGGGEQLSALKFIPERTFATEAYEPNVEVARKQLSPLGVVVKEIERDDALPFENQLFDRVINRHEAFVSSELQRIIKPGGIFITQQVGGEDCIGINDALGAPKPTYSGWNCEVAVSQLKEQGFKILHHEEQKPVTRFYEIESLVRYLKIIEWQVEDFSVEKYGDELKRISDQIDQAGSFNARSHRFFIIAKR